MRRVRGFGRFWWAFVVGDDWRVAAGVALALGLAAVLVHEAGVDAWWLVPAAVALVLAGSLRRAAADGSAVGDRAADDEHVS